MINIAIDGPSGSGKSTVAKELAKTLGIIYVDTGAMYRAVAFYNADPNDQAAVEASLPDISIDIRYDEDSQQRLILNGEDVTEELRSQEVGAASSVVASYPAVRQKLMEFQREIASKNSVIMDGRDIGTHILPNAQVKIYLDASPDERAVRRINELKQKGEAAEFETVKEALKIRDNRDMNRDIAPLVKADDAVYIKSDGLSVEDIMQMIIKEVEGIK